MLHTISRLNSLLKRPRLSFSDHIVIQGVYLALASFFSASNTSGKTGKGKHSEDERMRNLRLSGMGTLRVASRIIWYWSSLTLQLFARYETQRQWIIEETLGSLARFANQDMRFTSVWPSNHLFYSLTYRLTHGGSTHMSSALLILLVQTSASAAAHRVRASLAPEPEATDGVKHDSESSILNEAMEEAGRAARLICNYLMQR